MSSSASSAKEVKAKRGIPRAVEVPLALMALVLASPLLLITAIGVLASSRGPVIFRQQRVGREGRPFTILKFRTMELHDGGPEVTATGDARITGFGRVLRGLKLDELPQLWNVLKGDMSLVGPRPEVPKYVDLDDPMWQGVLAVRPGIADLVTLQLQREEDLLAAVEGDQEQYYLEVLLPYKLKAYLDYLGSRTTWTDLRVLIRTAWTVLLPGDHSTPEPVEISEVAESDPERQV